MGIEAETMHSVGSCWDKFLSNKKTISNESQRARDKSMGIYKWGVALIVETRWTEIDLPALEYSLWLKVSLLCPFKFLKINWLWIYFCDTWKWQEVQTVQKIKSEKCLLHSCFPFFVCGQIYVFIFKWLSGVWFIFELSCSSVFLSRLWSTWNLF